LTSEQRKMTGSGRVGSGPEKMTRVQLSIVQFLLSDSCLLAYTNSTTDRERQQVVQSWWRKPER